MKYLVLRNCFTAECVYYKKGEIIKLPDAMFKDEKNFRLVEKSMTEPPPEPVPEAPETIKKPVKEAASTIPPETVSAPIVHKKVGKSLTCSCGKEYKTKYGLKQHLAKFNK